MNLYFDAMASTILAPEVAEIMLEVYNNYPGNVSSNHGYALALKPMIDNASQQIKQALNAKHYSVLWTSGATEAINLAIKGAAAAYQRQGKHIITFTTEHKATLEAVNSLAKDFKVDILDVKPSGLIDAEALAKKISPETILVSICHVNNEIGTVQDLQKLIKIIQDRGCLVHIDAAQSIGKAELDLAQMPADFISLSAHKFSGPQGIGALLIKQQPKRQLVPLIDGGKQQAFRAGTLPAALIIGMGHAITISNQIEPKIQEFAKQIYNMLTELKGVIIHGSEASRVAHNINIYIEGINAQALKYLLPNIALASGSACNADNLEPSHVLLAIGCDHAHAEQAIRISLGRHLTQTMVDQFCTDFREQVLLLRMISGYKHA